MGDELVRLGKIIEQLNHDKVSWKDRALVITAVVSMLIALGSLGINYWVGKQNIDNFDKQFKQSQSNFDKDFVQRYRPYLHLQLKPIQIAAYFEYIIGNKAFKTDDFNKIQFPVDTLSVEIQLSDSLVSSNLGFGPLWIDTNCTGLMLYYYWNDSLHKSTDSFITMINKTGKLKDYTPDYCILPDSIISIKKTDHLSLGQKSWDALKSTSAIYYDTLYSFCFSVYHDKHNNYYNTLRIIYVVFNLHLEDGLLKVSSDGKAAVEVYRLDLPNK
jgi:hypothetical protein